jgi:hypothetical protein
MWLRQRRDSNFSSVHRYRRWHMPCRCPLGCCFVCHGVRKLSVDIRLPVDSFADRPVEKFFYASKTGLTLSER